MPSSQKEVDDGVTDKKRSFTHRPARTPALVYFCASANACVFAPGCGKIRDLYAALCGAFAGVHALCSANRGWLSVAPQRRADGFLALWIAHAPYLRFTPRIAAISAASPRTCEPASHVR